MDDLDILRELARSVYVTARQRAALRRVVKGLAQAAQCPVAAPVESAPVEGVTTAFPSPPPILGPGDAQ